MKKSTLKKIVITLSVALAVTGGVLIYKVLNPVIVLPNPVGTPNELPKANERPLPKNDTVSQNTKDNGTGNSKKTPQNSQANTSKSTATSSSVINEPGDEIGGEKVAKGVITSMSTTFIKIKEEKTGEEMTFYRQGAEVDGKLAEELTAEIYYIGEDYKDAFVSRIVTFPPKG